MTNQPLDPDAPPTTSTGPDAQRAPVLNAVEARVAFVFRTTQRQGRIHPLLHLMQQYRAAQGATGDVL